MRQEHKDQPCKPQRVVREVANFDRIQDQEVPNECVSGLLGDLEIASSESSVS
ncbi:predicted protein [Botrytis cinerea T4]|uniref:Uncharacterized protein n=1 Tax=Botryotinia fuckeliana (strain T4) TaxID=999810 RepID=G2YTV5_BOTF4|nr:predicted protein [Botrytis cinerea T4]